LVLFSCDENNRGPWFELFRQGGISKRYEAIASRPADSGNQWLIESRIERGEPWLRFKNIEGEINDRSRISLVETRKELAKYVLEPITGKTHQLRLHMGLIGAHIVGDRFYPDFLPPQNPPRYDNPLQLLAKSLSFIDPVNGEARSFESRLTLDW